MAVRQNGVGTASALPALSARQQQIIGLLGSGPKATLELAKALSLTRAAVMNHLKALESAGIVAPTTEARTAPGTKWQITK